MEVKKMVTLYLTEEEVKQAIKHWVRSHAKEVDNDIKNHIQHNDFMIETMEDGGFAILIDGEVEE